ncbi:MAG TPA: SDR family oxidoreductase [Anaeromyxobacteraceae bacterium]|nr:SDR family oxidoreductase [Anaeromyxobacteraceae bacterium]
MASDAILFTGFPGFLGSELLPRVLARSPGRRAVCLVQAKFAELAKRRARNIAARQPELEGRIELLEGDITRPGLGTTATTALADQVVEIEHLAAAYDLSVTRELGRLVNVEGTRQVLAFAESCPHLEALHYVSTCYVSGRYPGRFRETDLALGQTFNNHYEETKYRAEVLVQEAMHRGMPVAIYRPAVVVGDSATGATQKYDGPYYVIRWVMKQGRLAFLPTVGDPKAVRLNVVPRDFVVRAIAYLSGEPRSRGVVFQLADPDPLTIDEVISEVSRASGRRVVRIPLPLALAKGAIDYVPFVERLLGIPSAAVDYFVHPTTYATDNTAAHLRGSGIELPRAKDYLPRMVEYVREHPDVPSAAMV